MSTVKLVSRATRAAIMIWSCGPGNSGSGTESNFWALIIVLPEGAEGDGFLLLNLQNCPLKRSSLVSMDGLTVTSYKLTSMKSFIPKPSFWYSTRTIRMRLLFPIFFFFFAQILNCLWWDVTLHLLAPAVTVAHAIRCKGEMGVRTRAAVRNSFLELFAPGPPVSLKMFLIFAFLPNWLKIKLSLLN